MARDVYHNVVRQALEQEGWVITHDPLRIKHHGLKLEIDLGAEKVIGAEKEGKKIAVEIKSFLNPSIIYDFHTALGQYRTYKRILRKNEPNRLLFLALSKDVFDSFFSQPFGLEAIEEEDLSIIVFDVPTQQIVKWIKP